MLTYAAIPGDSEYVPVDSSRQHTTTYVSADQSNRPAALRATRGTAGIRSTQALLHLLYMCPHPAIHMSSYFYICALTLLYLCPHPGSDRSSMQALLHLLYICPHTAIYVSFYRYILVLMQAATGAARRPHAALAGATQPQSEREQELRTETERERERERASKRERERQGQRERAPPPFQSARISGTTTSATTRALRSPPPTPPPPVTPPQRHMRQRSSPQRGRLMY